ncbi:MAG: hypothetical protein Q4E02_02555 [Lagierella massiliensis]|nr:hypothetical protein [Lagierella massiliensis]
MYKFPKQKIITNTLISIIPFIVLLLIIVADIILYAVDIMVTPYIMILFYLLIVFFNHNDRNLVLGYILVLVSLISFLYLKPNYTINQATQALKKSAITNIKLEQLGYVKRKNILIRGAYVFCTEDGKLIIFDNINGKFHMANN